MAVMEWKIGNVRITKVVERELPVPLDGLLHGVPAEPAQQHPWLKPDFLDDDGNARLSIHGLVIDTGERRILVDTCMGDNRAAGQVPGMPSDFLEQLAAAGYEVDDIDTVACTHLHFDHVGWNTRLQDGEWVVTFPNARYLFAQAEWDHWQSHDHEYIDLADTVRPVVESGQADLVATDHRICDEVRFVPTPGHTPGHVCVLIESQGERAVITGDMAHHPLQLAEPQIGMSADSDGALAIETRRRFNAERVEDGALVIGTHFGGRTAGHVVADGDAWRFDP
jgi:glyoxylase-like metal-dependent hydrolase (beta-lactamase superfamily II)